MSMTPQDQIKMLRSALEGAITFMARLDTIRHLELPFPALDNARVALAATSTPPSNEDEAVKGCWISVADRLPDTDVSVLVAMPNGYISKTSWWMGEFITPSSAQPTHWMSIPPAPTSKKDA